MHHVAMKERWDHTAMLKSTMINLKVENKHDAVDFEDCHPLRARVRDFSEIKHEIFRHDGIRAVN